MQYKTVTNKRIVLISERKMEMTIKALSNVEYGKQDVPKSPKVVQRDVNGIYGPNGEGRNDTKVTLDDIKSEAVRICCFLCKFIHSLPTFLPHFVHSFSPVHFLVFLCR